MSNKAPKPESQIHSCSPAEIHQACSHLPTAEQDLFPFTLTTKDTEGNLITRPLSANEQSRLVKDFLAKQEAYKQQQAAYLAQSWLDFIQHKIHRGSFKLEQLQQLDRELLQASQQLSQSAKENDDTKATANNAISALSLLIKLGLALGCSWLDKSKETKFSLLLSLWEQWLDLFTSAKSPAVAFTRKQNKVWSRIEEGYQAYQAEIAKLLQRENSNSVANTIELEEKNLLTLPTLWQQSQLGISWWQNLCSNSVAQSSPNHELSQLQKQIHHPRLVAVSGGIDSLALSIALVIFGFPLAISHINHGFNRHAAAWQDFIEKELAELGIASHLHHTPLIGILPALQNGNAEALARKYRYQNLFQRILSWRAEAGVMPELLIAHHQDEQAEQLLLNLNRGADSLKLATGLKSKTSYKLSLPLTVQAKNFILPAKLVELTTWRPLLNFKKVELQGWLADYGIGYAYDQMNFSPDYQRVKYRNLLNDGSFKQEQLISSFERQGQQSKLLQGYLTAELKQILGLAETRELKDLASLDLTLLLDHFAEQQPLIRDHLLDLVNHWLELQSAPQLTASQFTDLLAKLSATNFAPQILLSLKLSGISDSLVYYYWQQGLRVYSVSSEYLPSSLANNLVERANNSAAELFACGRTALSIQGLIINQEYYLISRYPLFLDSSLAELPWYSYKLESIFKFKQVIRANKKQRQKLTSIPQLQEFLQQQENEGVSEENNLSSTSLTNHPNSALRTSIASWQQHLAKISGLSSLASELTWQDISWLELNTAHSTPEVLNNLSQLTRNELQPLASPPAELELSLVCFIPVSQASSENM